MTDLNIILNIKFGSWLYGTNTPDSDLDYKAIYLPTAKEIVLGNYSKTITSCRPKREFERNTKDDIDIEILSLDRFLQLLVQGQTMALDMLYSPEFIATLNQRDNPLGSIFSSRCKLINRNINAFIGYARQQAAKYGIKGTRVAAMRQILELLQTFDDPFKLKDYAVELELWVSDVNNEHIKFEMLSNAQKTALEPYLSVCNRKIPLHATVKYTRQCFQKIYDEYGKRSILAANNCGIDYKALSHAARVNSEGIELLTTGYITFPRPDRELLLDIKLGKLPYIQISEIIERGLDELVIAQKNSILPEKSDETWVENFVFDVYSDIVKNQ